MNRSLFALVALLLSSSALAAPAPIPQPFVSGWDKPLDPDRDCKIKREKGTLIMEMPGSDHDYDPRRGQSNAPRLLREREIEGDFVMQVRVRIDCRPSFQSTVDGQPSSASAGFLVMSPQNNPVTCVRMEFVASRKGSGVRGYVDVRRWGQDARQGGRIREGARGLEKEWRGDAYLRLERRDGDLCYYVSSDGENWKGLGATGGLREKLKVGLAAYSTSKDSSKVVFDQFTIPSEHKREPWGFVSGWGHPVDPDKDCKIHREKDSLTIEMPGTDHDYDPIRKRFNAPRLLSKLEGKFDLQVRVRIDYRPSAKSTVKGQPSLVSAGFLLIYPERNYSICFRMENAVSQQGSRPDAYAEPPFLALPRRNAPAPKGMESESYAAMQHWIGSRVDRTEWDHGEPHRLPNFISIWDRGWQHWPLPDKVEYVYLRMEQGAELASFFISPDGKKWTRLCYSPNLPPKGELALAAYSTSPEPSKVRFDQLKLWQGKKKEQRGQEQSKEKAAEKTPAAKADPAVLAKLIEQLGSHDFQTREKASQKLVQFDEVPDALRQAAKNSDSEISQRAQAVIDIITKRVEERVFRAIVRNLHKIELDRFVRRMVTEPKFADDEQWKIIQTVARAVIDDANKSTGRRFQVPDFSVNKMRRRLVNTETQNLSSFGRTIVLCTGTAPYIPSINNSLFIVDGDFMGATSIDKSLLIVRGNIGGVFSVTDSIILATGSWTGDIACNDSFVQVNNHLMRLTASSDSVLLNTMIRTTGNSTSRVLKTDKGPLQLLKFSPRPTDAQLVWSEQVADLAVALVPVDENGRVLIRWKNASKEALQLPWVRLHSDPIASNQDDLLGHVFLKGSDGKLVPALEYPPPRRAAPLWRGECVILGPGRTFEEVIDLWSYVEKPAAGGKYQLSVELDAPEGRRVMERTVKAWSGKIRSKTLQIAVSK